MRHWHNQAVIVSVPEHIKGSPHRELACEPSAAQLQFGSARHLFPKLLRSFDCVHMFTEKPHTMYTNTPINVYVTFYSI